MMSGKDLAGRLTVTERDSGPGHREKAVELTRTCVSHATMPGVHKNGEGGNPPSPYVNSFLRKSRERLGHFDLDRLWLRLFPLRKPDL